MPQFRGSPVLIIGHYFYHNRHAARAITFIGIFFNSKPFKLAGALLYCPINVILGFLKLRKLRNATNPTGR